MPFGSDSVIYPTRGMHFFQILLVFLKLLKAMAFYAAYDVLKFTHTLAFLFILKISTAAILFPLQKPFSSGFLKPLEWFNVAKFAVVRLFLDALWIEGLILCGPFRFILLFEHSELVVITVVSTVIYGSSNTQKTRGVVFFIFGILSLIFFDHDHVQHTSDHPEGVHKSLLIHRVYELFANFGLSDHKVGVMVLLVTICLDAAFAAASRKLVASLGGSKRVHALSSLVSLVLLIPAVIWIKVYHLQTGTAEIKEEETLGLIMENVEDKAPREVESSTQLGVFVRIVLFSLVHALDFFFASLVSSRLGAQAVTNLGKLCITVAAFLLCFVWSSDRWFLWIFETKNIVAEAPKTISLIHGLSTGAFFSMLSILYATSLLTATRHGQGPEGSSSGHFIGYSMAGLPIYTPTHAPKHGASVLTGGSDSVGFWYHVRVTLRSILSESGSKRIFAFLCLNLAFTFVELLYGVWTNSLGLISDGFHMLFDSAALVVGLYAAVVAQWKPTRIFSYGFHSAEVLSGFVNALFLIVISSSIFVNALARIHRPPEIKTDRLLTVSIAGLLVNLVGMVALGHAHSHGGSSCSNHGHSHAGGSEKHSHSAHGHSHNAHGHSHNAHGHSHAESGHGHSHSEHNSNPTVPYEADLHYGHSHGHKQHTGSHAGHSHEGDANLRGVYLHVLADTLGSVAVIFSSFLISNYGWNIADPICSVFLACAIGCSAMPLLNDTLSLLTLRAPYSDHPADPSWIVKRVMRVEGVQSVFNPFVWSQTRNTTCVCLSVVIHPTAAEQLVLARIKELFAMHCPDVTHLTVQIEKDDIQHHYQALGIHPKRTLTFSRSDAEPIQNGQLMSQMGSAFSVSDATHRPQLGSKSVVVSLKSV